MAAPIKSQVDHVVMPGDEFCHSSFEPGETLGEQKRLLIGPGLSLHTQDTVRAVKCGFLRYKKPNVYWVDSRESRYIPAIGDCVIGIVMNKMGDYFRVDIGSHKNAYISFMAFEGATKKNRPNLQTRDLIYARVCLGDKLTDPQIECMDKYNKANGLGVISTGEGMFLRVSSVTVRKLLSPTGKLLKSLGKSYQFEVTAGSNSRVWLNAKCVADTIRLANLIHELEFTPREELKENFRTMFEGG